MRYVLATLCALAVSATTYAEEKNEQSATEKVWAGASRVFAGAGFNFTEMDGDDNSSNKLEGWFWAGRTGFQYTEREDVFGTAEVTWNGGSVTEKDNGSVNFRGYAHTYGAKGRLGYMWGFGDNNEFGFAPYFGFGYGGSSMNVHDETVVSGKFSSRFWYAPIGVYFDWIACEDFSVGLFAEAQLAFGYRFWESITGQSDVTVSGKNEVNWKVELPITYQITKIWDLQFTPFWQNLTMNPNLNSVFYKDSHTTSNASGALLELGVRF